jgi:hypothetical protein
VVVPILHMTCLLETNYTYISDILLLFFVGSDILLLHIINCTSYLRNHIYARHYINGLSIACTGYFFVKQFIYLAYTSQRVQCT